MRAAWTGNQLVVHPEDAGYAASLPAYEAVQLSLLDRAGVAGMLHAPELSGITFVNASWYRTRHGILAPATLDAHVFSGNRLSLRSNAAALSDMTGGQKGLDSLRADLDLVAEQGNDVPETTARALLGSPLLRDWAEVERAAAACYRGLLDLLSARQAGAPSRSASA